MSNAPTNRDVSNLYLLLEKRYEMSTIAKSAPEATMTSFSGKFAQIFEKIYRQ